MTTPADQKRRGLAQAPGAPDLKAKPPAGGMFAVVVLCCGLFAALSPSEGGRRLEPYLDSSSIPTACTGLIGPEVTRRWKAKERFTEGECKSLETAYVTKMVRQMSACVPIQVRADMTYGEWISYGHWSYNTGTASFCSSGVSRLLAKGDHVAACKAMGKWTWTTVPLSRVPRGAHRAVRDGTGRQIAWRIDCADSANKCSGLATRRDLEVSTCLSAVDQPGVQP